MSEATTIKPFVSELSLTLYDVESNLAAYADTEDMVASEDRSQFEAELASALVQAVAKRDSFAQFLQSCESQVASCDAEIKRLQERKARFSRMHERAAAFGAKVITSLGTDAKGKYRKLEGRTATLAVRKNPDKVTITDEEKVPIEYKNVTIKMSGRTWLSIFNGEQSVIDAILNHDATTDSVVDKRQIKADIELDIEVPGADIAFGEYVLKVS